jgi:hypothetical protein
VSTSGIACLSSPILLRALDKMVAGFCSVKHTTAMFNRRKDIQKALIDNKKGTWDIRTCLLVIIYELRSILLLSCSDRHSHVNAEGAIQFLLTLVCLLND